MVWACGSVVAGWPQSLTCSEVKHRPTSLVHEWVITRVFSDDFSPHIHVFLNQRNLLQNPNVHSCRWLRSIKKIIKYKPIEISLELFLFHIEIIKVTLISIVDTINHPIMIDQSSYYDNHCFVHVIFIERLYYIILFYTYIYIVFLINKMEYKLYNIWTGL